MFYRLIFTDVVVSVFANIFYLILELLFIIFWFSHMLGYTSFVCLMTIVLFNLSDLSVCAASHIYILSVLN